MSTDPAAMATTSGPAAAPGPPSAVLCSSLTYRFGSYTAVNCVNLRIGQGEIFGLLGPNGAGKTTTIRMLTTLLKPKSGIVTVFGTNAMTHPMRVRKMIGYVPQLLSADSALTGRENVQLFARLFDIPRRARRDQVDRVLAATGLTKSADRLVSAYSGGMVRRLELAQALVNVPRLLILDEPTVGLDPIARTDVWEYISRLREELGMTVLMTTHYMDEADTYCDRIALMHQGTIRATGSPADLKAGLSDDTSLDEVFRHYTGGILDGPSQQTSLPEPKQGGLRDIRETRRATRRLG